MTPRLDLSSDYWTVVRAEPVLYVNGCRIHLDHWARVLAAKRLESYNREYTQEPQ